MDKKELYDLYKNIKKVSELSSFKEELERNNVHIVDPDSFYVSNEKLVYIDKGTIILPGVYFLGVVTIGEDCIVGPNITLCRTIVNSRSVVGARPQIFDSRIGKETIIGHMAEIVRSKIGDHTFIQHLSYIGDSEIGEGVNIGAGSVIGNFDGQEKHRTVIKDKAFTGINSSIVAPSIIGEEACIAAHSMVRKKEIPAHSIVVGDGRILEGRSWHKTEKGWEQRKKEVK